VPRSSPTYRSRISSGHAIASLTRIPAGRGLVQSSGFSGRLSSRMPYAQFVTTTAERLRDARVKADRALACVRADQGASPVLIAVVSEFALKAEKAAHADDERVAVIELEQAGDSAKAAAEADTGVADATRQSVLDAHLAICIAKAKL
jgi:hypothetical protein